MNPELLECLGSPDCYPGQVDSVQVLQTHLSVVCLAGDRAYKLKKPVRFPFADFSTPALREKACHDEVRLNRRLCPTIYLGVVPLRKIGPNHWSFREDAGGEVVDHAVLMRRLPDDRLLNRLLNKGAVGADPIREIAGIMARFHARSEGTPEVLKAGSPDHLRHGILDNLSESRKFAGNVLDPALLAGVENRAASDLNRLMPVLEERAAAGRIVDGHGDLHTRNIFLTDPPAIFDCIEFNREFRCGDVAVENAFLVMDLIYRGHPDLARIYLDAYIGITGDEQQRRLMPMLVSFRAMVRAKVAALASEEEEIGTDGRREARESARRHLLLAAAAPLGDERLLVVFCGLPGTGKSSIATHLSALSGWPVFSSDRIRKELAGAAPEDRLPDKCYTPEASRRVYQELTHRTSLASQHGHPVIVDANFPSRERRLNATTTMAAQGASVVLVHVETDEAVVMERLAQRTADAGEVSDADPIVYRNLRRSFEAPDPSEGNSLVRLDGGAPVEASLRSLLLHLLTLGPRG